MGANFRGVDKCTVKPTGLLLTLQLLSRERDETLEYCRQHANNFDLKASVLEKINLKISKESKNTKRLSSAGHSSHTGLFSTTK